VTTLNTTCYTVQNGKIVECILADYACYIERTTRPTGVGFKYYVTTVARDIERFTDQVDEDGYVITETVKDDVWVLAKWASWGGPEVVVCEFASEEEARAAAVDTYFHDILHNDEITIHLDRASAELELAGVDIVTIGGSV